MDLGLAISLQKSSTVPSRFLESIPKASRPLINQQASVSFQTFRSKLEDLEQTIESQKQGIRSFIRPEPIIGLKPGGALGGGGGVGAGGGLGAGGIGGVGIGTHPAADADADADAELEEDAATVPGDDESMLSTDSSGSDSMMLGELHDSG